MHPYNVGYELETCGFWYTYWSARQSGESRIHCLWVIWVGWQYNRHQEGRTLMSDIVG